ncbi:hypothetical protein E2F43_15095 [Seongchinamella unica]|uniref:Polysaccharide biosynthesis protein n=1 Tax=Seongchinamella unica TaxID=2547392 RepID=A0A4R5LQR4_9GAMM|nr:hypothetical protein [Seongchinamella unica]TDG12881.1 hypothetical protein E2F43_15095 [Seongchinamella unica]
MALDFMSLRFSKVVTLVALGMPGVYRIIAFGLIQNIHGVGQLGVFASNYFIVQVLMIPTAVGLSGLVLTRLPKLDKIQSLKFFYSCIWTLFLLLVLSIFPLILLVKLGVLKGLVDCFFLLASFGLVQIVRSYYISQNLFSGLLGFELILLALSVLLLLAFDFVDPMVLVSLGGIIPVIAFLLKHNSFVGTSLLPRVDVAFAWRVSLSNLLTAPIILLITPIIRAELGDEAAGISGLSIAIYSAVLLIPRSMSAVYLRRMSQSVFDLVALKKLFFEFRFLLNIFLAALIVLSAASISLIMSFKELVGVSEPVLLAVLMATAFPVLMSQFSLPASNFFMARERLESLNQSNFVCLAVIVSVYLFCILCQLSGLNFVWALAATVSISSLARAKFLNSLVGLRE